MNDRANPNNNQPVNQEGDGRPYDLMELVQNPPDIIGGLIADYENRQAAPNVAHPPQRPATQPTTAPLNFAGGEILTGIAVINQSIDGAVFGEIPEFLTNVRAGRVTDVQRAAFVRGGNEFARLLDADSAGEFAALGSRFANAVREKAYPGQAAQPELYSGIAAAIDAMRTSGLTPQEIAQQMNSGRLVDTAVAIVHAIEGGVGGSSDALPGVHARGGSAVSTSR